MTFETSICRWGGFVFLKLAKDQIAPAIDSDMVDFISRSNLNGKNVIDGGSNIGVVSMFLSEAVGGGLVYSFELQRLIFQIGCANAILNSRPNIISFNAALSDESGNMVGFSDIDYGSEKVSSTGIRTEPKYGSIDYYDRVKTIALDDLNIQNVGLIKLDLEGSEPEALVGMKSTIQRCKPNMIIELSPGYLGDEGIQKTIDLIKSQDYSVTEGMNYNYFAEPK